MVKALKLAFDGRCAQYKGHGVASYSLGLIESLASINDRFDYVFVVDTHLSTSHIRFPQSSAFICTTVSKDSKARDFWEQVILPRRLSQMGVHLFHGLDYVVPIARVPFVKVATFHDAIAFTPLDNRPFLSRFRLRLLLRAIVASVDAIIADSEFSKQEIGRYLPSSKDKTTRIWSGIADTFFMPVRAQDIQACITEIDAFGSFVLYYGGFRKHKNVELLLRAFQVIRCARDISLVLVGRLGDASQQIRNAIRSLGLENAVILYGFAAEEELKVLLDKCSVFVSPSSIEGFGLPVAEAMARGAPVVCSSKASLPEVAGDAAVYFGGTEVEDLVLGIERVLDDEGLRRHLKQRGMARAQQFRWKNAIRQFSDLYLRLIEAKFGA